MSWSPLQKNGGKKTTQVGSEKSAFPKKSCPVTKVAHKRPWTFWQKCRWQVTSKHTYTLGPTSRSGHCHCPGIVWEPTTEENELTCKLSGKTQPQSSQLTEPLWTDPGLKKVELVSMSCSPLKEKRRKQKKSTEREWKVEPSPKILASETNTTTTLPLGTFTQSYLSHHVHQVLLSGLSLEHLSKHLHKWAARHWVSVRNIPWAQTTAEVYKK